MNSKNVSIVIARDHRRLRFGICCLHCIYTIILSLCRAKEYSQPAERIGQCAVHSSAVQGEIESKSPFRKM